MHLPSPSLHTSQDDSSANKMNTASCLHALLEKSNDVVVDIRAVHGRAVRTSAADRCLRHRLITLYSKFPPLQPYSGRLFAQISSPNVVSWTSLISAHSASPAALRHFVSMLRFPALPNPRTLASLLRTCAALLSVRFGLSVHSLAVKVGLSSETFTGSALLDFYLKCRHPWNALKVFDEVPEKDEVCYSAMVVGLAKNSRPVDALSVFAGMRRDGIESTIYSISGALKAVSEMAALEQCGMIHAHAVSAGFYKNAIIAAALIDGYGKSGLVSEAKRVFYENLRSLNLVGWNAMMSAYSQQGDTESVIKLFNELNCRAFVPDRYTFLAILSACNNGGSSVEDVERWFTRMRSDYGLEPRLEHYTCLVNAMARVNRLEEAESLAFTMPFKPDAVVWRTLLMACRHQGTADKAKMIAKRLLEVDPTDESAYVIASSALSVAGKWDEVAEVMKAMKGSRVRKEAGQSWVEVRGKIHVFVAGDRSHERRDEIYAKLDEIIEAIEQLGYKPIIDESMHHESAIETNTRERLRHHSEKLAAAFGLLQGVIPPGKAIRIVKNLRICRDCHEMFRYMSKLVVNREILVRDVNRYHRFSDGVCSCRDFW